jgi:hypothetical protein
LSKSKKKSSSGSRKFVEGVRGISLAVKLYGMSPPDLSTTKLKALLKDNSYEPINRRDILREGFGSVKSKGKVISAEFFADFRVQVLTYGEDGSLSSEPVKSVDRAHILIKLDKNVLEIRGAERTARKFLKQFEELTGVSTSPLNLDGGAKKLYDSAAEISSVLFSGLEKGNLSQVELKGESIQTEDEIALYTRRYKGQINRFRGSFAYPSGAFLTTSINAQAGSFVVYKSGDGILEKDLSWIVELMEDAALK